MFSVENDSIYELVSGMNICVKLMREEYSKQADIYMTIHGL